MELKLPDAAFTVQVEPWVDLLSRTGVELKHFVVQIGVINQAVDVLNRTRVELKIWLLWVWTRRLMLICLVEPGWN